MSLHLSALVSVGTISFTLTFEIIILFFSSRELFRWPRLPPDTPNSTALHLGKRSVLMIAFASFFSVLNGAAFIANNLIGLLKLNPALCTPIPKLYTVAYGFMQISFYEFLRLRSLLVDSPGEKTLFFRALRFFTTYSIRIGAPAFQIAVLIFWSGVIVEEDGVSYCVDDNTWPFYVAFTVLVFPLSCAFMFLFISPLWQHVHEMKRIGSAKSDSIWLIIHRNFILSTVAIVSTTSVMILLTTVASSNPVQPALFTASNCLSNFDLLLNLLCMCMMTLQWLPPHLRPRATDESKATITAAHSPAEGQPVKVPFENNHQVQPDVLVLASLSDSSNNKAPT